MERLFWICMGGAAGAGSRYVIAIWAAQRFGSAFPFGTLIVNIGGCFLISLIMDAAVLTSSWPTLRAALSIGFVGGLTTYSSFNFETTRLLQEGAPDSAGLNVLLTAIGGFAAGWLGLVVSRHLFGQ